MLRMEIHPLTPGRLEDLADLFKTSTATRGCWCMWFINPAKDVQAGWGDGRIRLVFEALAQTADPPLGLLAYEGDRPGRMAGNRTEVEISARRLRVLGIAEPSPRRVVMRLDLR